MATNQLNGYGKLISRVDNKIEEGMFLNGMYCVYEKRKEHEYTFEELRYNASHYSKQYKISTISRVIQKVRQNQMARQHEEINSLEPCSLKAF